MCVWAEGLGWKDPPPAPFPALYPAPSCSDAPVTHTQRQATDFLWAHLQLQSSGGSTSGWWTSQGLFVGDSFFFFFFFLTLLADKTTALVRQRRLLAAWLCWTAFTSQTLTAAGLWFPVLVLLPCHWQRLLSSDRR